MSRREVRARAWRVAVALTAAGGALACLDRRSRLDVPRVTLVVDDSIVAPGGTVRGRARAVDESGIIFLSVTVFTDDSAKRVERNRVAADSIDLEFELGVATNAAPDAVVSVRALARDNQDFQVIVLDTVFVRVPPLS